LQGRDDRDDILPLIVGRNDNGQLEAHTVMIIARRSPISRRNYRDRRV
jgi:hypothetical protein